jgi:hypothetical protein
MVIKLDIDYPFLTTLDTVETNMYNSYIDK